MEAAAEHAAASSFLVLLYIRIGIIFHYINYKEIFREFSLFSFAGIISCSSIIPLHMSGKIRGYIP